MGLSFQLAISEMEWMEVGIRTANIYVCWCKSNRTYHHPKGPPFTVISKQRTLPDKWLTQGSSILSCGRKASANQIYRRQGLNLAGMYLTQLASLRLTSSSSL